MVKRRTNRRENIFNNMLKMTKRGCVKSFIEDGEAFTFLWTYLAGKMIVTLITCDEEKETLLKLLSSKGQIHILVSEVWVRKDEIVTTKDKTDDELKAISLGDYKTLENHPDRMEALMLYCFNGFEYETYWNRIRRFEDRSELDGWEKIIDRNVIS